MGVGFFSPLPKDTEASRRNSPVSRGSQHRFTLSSEGAPCRPEVHGGVI